VSTGEINLDRFRSERIGLEEAIFCAHKSDAQIRSILERLLDDNAGCLLTRLDGQVFERIGASFKSLMDYEESSNTAYFNKNVTVPVTPDVAIVTAGSSDVPVAREALRTLNYFGVGALPIFDVGIAGLWRLLDRLDDVRQFPIAIVVAGMDAALPSVLGGLYPGLIVAVPTSVGYGVAAGGTTALNSILASCASGLVTVNIDNGYGAACAVLRVLRPQRHASISADKTAGSAHRS